MKTKIHLLFCFIPLFATILVIDSCKKDEAVVYPADRLIGTWSVDEIVDGGTAINYTSTSTKKDNEHIIISSTRSNPPVYFVNNLSIYIDWNKMELTGPGVVTGTIKNGDDFEITYLYGTYSHTYDVVQHYTRIK